MPVQEIQTSAQFQDALKSRSHVLALFATSWCGHSIAVKPVFNQRSNEVKQVLFLHIDVDKQRELAGRAGVQVVPTFVAYHNGQKVRVDTGSRTGLVDDLLSKLLKPQ